MIGTRRASETSSASRPPTTCRPWPTPSLSRSWARGACSFSRTDPYFGTDVATAARNLGLEIVGSTQWSAEARNFERLARRIARTRADAVFIGGFLYPNGGALVRDLRARLGPDVALVATDGFGPVPDLIEAAGPAARGMYLSVWGVPNGELPPPGKQFLEEFEATRAGEPSPSLRRVRRPGGGDPARRDRPLRRHAVVGDRGASPDDGRGRHPRGHPLRRVRRPRGGAGDHLPRRRQGPPGPPARLGGRGRRSGDHRPRGLLH